LELLGKLLGMVQLQANSVLPLLRAVGQVFTVEGLDILQIKSIGAQRRRFRPQSLVCSQLLQALQFLCGVCCNATKGIVKSEGGLNRNCVLGLLVAGFKRFKGHRGALLDELMAAVIPNLPTSKRTARSFVIGDGAATNIQMISALLLQLFQVGFLVNNILLCVFGIIFQRAG
jgi:hypothetical protein